MTPSQDPPTLSVSLLGNDQAPSLGKRVERQCGVLPKADKAIGLLAAIVTSSDDAIIGKPLEGIITSWNASAERRSIVKVTLPVARGGIEKQLAEHFPGLL